MSITKVFGNARSTGDEIKTKKDTAVYTQEQYTPSTAESRTTVKQTQSIKVNPEIRLISPEDVVHIDSTINGWMSKIDSYILNRKEEVKKGEQREAMAYLFVLPTVFLLSLVGVWIGNRVENNSITWLSVVAFEIAFLIFLLKVPIIF